MVDDLAGEDLRTRLTSSAVTGDSMSTRQLWAIHYSYSYIYICYCLWRWQTVNRQEKKYKKNWFQWRLFRVDLRHILLSDWLSERFIHQRRLWSSCITVHKRNIWLSAWSVFCGDLSVASVSLIGISVHRDRIRTTTTTTCHLYYISFEKKL